MKKEELNLGKVLQSIEEDLGQGRRHFKKCKKAAVIGVLFHAQDEMERCSVTNIIGV